MDQIRKGRKDHPRVCGEKTSAGSPQAFLIGSPPRMRGKVAGALRNAAGLGITPAYAGKSRTLGTGGSGRRDHPRVCGEKFTFFVFCPYVLGSPPRMRGKAWHSALYVFHCGITPAYAGKSFASGYRSQILWDHPRVCGEKKNARSIFVNLTGSPPRMRGKD